MGLFKKIRSGFKKVFKGVKKVFAKGLALIGKITGSKWGKILMLGAALFTGGMALAAGFQGFAGSTASTFLGKFVHGASAFVKALANPIAQAKKVFGAGAPVSTSLTASQAAAPGNILSQATSGLNVARGVTGPTLGPVAQGVLSEAGGLVAQQGTTQAGGWLARAAKAASDFAKSPAGAGLIKGMGEGMAAEQQNVFTDRYRRAWADPNNPFARLAGEDLSISGGPAPTRPVDPRSNVFENQFNRFQPIVRFAP